MGDGPSSGSAMNEAVKSRRNVRSDLIVEVKVSSRLVLDDPSVAVTACVVRRGNSL
jgi:hypothetical protein